MKWQVGNSSTWTRFVTATAVLLPVLGLLCLGGVFMRLLAWIIFLAINYEFYTSLHPALYERRYQLLLLSALVPASFQIFGPVGLAGGLVLAMLLLGVFFVVEIERGVHELDFATAFPAAVLGLCYPGLLGSLFIAVCYVVEPSWVLWLLGTVICADTFAYFGGRAIGGEKLAPRLSPKKTVSGAVCGLGGRVVASLCFAFVLGLGPTLVVFFLGLLAAVLALVGDLVESMVKRAYGVKDMGSFLPGHGGFIDRVDALVFALPVLFLVHLI
jgi:phosphatidate cytidylyltransferase